MYISYRLSKHFVALALIFLILVLMLPSVSSAQDSIEADVSPMSMTVSETTLGQGPSITYCVEKLPEIANPQRSLQPEVADVVGRLIFDTLVKIDPDTGQIVPSLAESWAISDNGRVYTFKLRQGVRFQELVSGSNFAPRRTLTADDVVFSFQRQGRVNHPYYLIGEGEYVYYRGMQLDWELLAVDKLDDYTVEFTLRNADVGFLYDLAMDFAIVQSAEYGDQLLRAQKMRQIDEVPVGTGAYQWAGKTTDTVTLYANPLYWKGKLDYQRIKVKAIPDPIERNQSYIRGDCHLVSPFSGAELGQSMDIVGDSFPFEPKMELLYLSFSAISPSFSALPERLAIANIINKPAIVGAALGRSGIVAQELVPKSHWLFDHGAPSPVRFSASAQQRANLALERLRARYAPKPLKIIVSQASKSYLLNPESAGRKIVEQLNNAGIFATLEVLSHERFLLRTQNGNYDLALIGWRGENGDLDNFLYPILSCTQVYGNNRSQWCDEDVERWLKEARITEDFEKRKVIYQRILRRVSNQLPIIPLAHTAQYLPRRSELRSVALDMRGGLRWNWFVFSPVLIEEPEETIELFEEIVPEISIEDLRTLE